MLIAVSQASALQGPPVDADSACVTGGSGSGSDDADDLLMGNAGFAVGHSNLPLSINPRSAEISTATATLALHDPCAFNLDLRGLTPDTVTVNGAPAAWERLGGELTITPTPSLAWLTPA